MKYLILCYNVFYPILNLIILFLYRPGGIILDFAIIMDKSSNINDFNQTIQQHVSSQTFGNITVKNETIISRTTCKSIIDN